MTPVDMKLPPAAVVTVSEYELPATTVVGIVKVRALDMVYNVPLASVVVTVGVNVRLAAGTTPSVLPVELLIIMLFIVAAGPLVC